MAEQKRNLEDTSGLDEARPKRKLRKTQKVLENEETMKVGVIEQSDLEDGKLPTDVNTDMVTPFSLDDEQAGTAVRRPAAAAGQSTLARRFFGEHSDGATLCCGQWVTDTPVIFGVT